MSKSEEHLYRSLDIMKADSNLSEDTKIIMFVEYARLVLAESKLPMWVIYNWYKIDTRPKHTGKYFVRRKDGKIHWETWNGSGWAYNNDVITHYQEIKPPHIGIMEKILNYGK